MHDKIFKKKLALSVNVHAYMKAGVLFHTVTQLHDEANYSTKLPVNEAYNCIYMAIAIVKCDKNTYYAY